MAIVMQMVSSDIPDMTGYKGVAEVRYGANGDYNYYSAEYGAGNSSNGYTSGRAEWDSNPDDGIDTGYTPVQMVADARTGAMTWYVNGAEDGTLAVNMGTFNQIRELDIRAADSIAGSMSWEDVSVKFYNDDVLVYQYDATQGPAIDQTSSGNPGTQQDLLQIWLNEETANKVVVTANIRMTADLGWYPDENSMFGQIFVSDLGLG